jgi:hypothetical protein
MIPPDHARLRLADLREVAHGVDLPVVVQRVRSDGTVELATRSTATRLSIWLRRMAGGQPDTESARLNALLARQLMSTRHGARIIAATDGVGMQGKPLLARDVQRVVEGLEQHGAEELDEFDYAACQTPGRS